jgi:lipoate-protein ligase A
VDAPALVLGSGQEGTAVDQQAADRAGVEITTRRSGGGAVLLEPGAGLWADVLLPAGDPLWDDDVVRAATWLGDTWQRALAVLGVASEVHRGRLHAGAWGAQLCFAGLGPGEVTVAGRKLVGLSQRRTRTGARLQCVVLPGWDPAPTLALLALSPAERAEAARAVRPPPHPVPLAAPPRDLTALEAAFLAELP